MWYTGMSVTLIAILIKPFFLNQSRDGQNWDIWDTNVHVHGSPAEIFELIHVFCVCVVVKSISQTVLHIVVEGKVVQLTELEKISTFRKPYKLEMMRQIASGIQLNSTFRLQFCN